MVYVFIDTNMFIRFYYFSLESTETIKKIDNNIEASLKWDNLTNRTILTLSENLNTNFNDFINHYRLNYFKTIAVDPKNSHLTILGLAYDSGFNSKSVFNTYFKKIEGITELRDESNKEGMRIVIELRRGEMPDVIMNNLYAQTQLENVFGINMVALVDGEPKTINLKQSLEIFVKHRREVVTRRTVYLLRKARERGHILEGLTVALANIDPVIELIKQSPTSAEAKERLLAQAWNPGDVTSMLEKAGEDACRPDDLDPQYGMRDGKYFLSPVQAQEILNMRLHRLTGLETEKLISEYKEILDRIAEFLLILSDPVRLMEVIREELEEVLAEYGDERRSEIISSKRDLTVADLITEEDLVVTISHGGYAKTQPVEDYQAQRRGGRGKSSTSMKDEDFIEKLLVANSHDTILCFSNRGKVYWLRVFEIPQASRGSRGRPMVNILPLDEGDETVEETVDLRGDEGGDRVDVPVM